MMLPGAVGRISDHSPHDKATLLRVEHLDVVYETNSAPVRAVHNVSFTLHRGEILGLAGESGSGKSTLAYAIARLLRPPAVVTSGKVRYYPHARQLEGGISDLDDVREGDDALSQGAVDILHLSQKQLRAFRWQELAIVFQSAMNALNPVMRLEAQMLDVLKTHNPSMGQEARRQRALELLRLVGISPDRLRSYPHELSGGMRQRAIIAIALALNPEIIIMDEPTTALDVVVQRDILVELMALREHLSFAVIFITHDLSLLLEIADRVAIMYAGRLVEIAPWQELYRHPRHPYTYGLLHSFPSLHGPQRRMSGIPGSPPDLRSVPPGCAYRPRCPFAFDTCSERLPVLAAPQMAGIHIGESGLEADGQTTHAEGQQIEKVACHLYAKVKEQPVSMHAGEQQEESMSNG